MESDFVSVMRHIYYMDYIIYIPYIVVLAKLFKSNLIFLSKIHLAFHK